MKKKTILFTLVAFLINLNAYSQCRLDKSNYILVFEDNFDTYTSISQMTTKWQFNNGTNCFGWGGKDSAGTYGEYYDQSQVSLQPGGILRFTSEIAPKTCTFQSGWTGPNLTIPVYETRSVKFKSGMIETKAGWEDPSDTYVGATGFRYGMFEARLKLPAKKSFPAFWLYGGATELDIMESGDLVDISNNTQDYPNGPSPNISKSCQVIYNNFPTNNFSDDFHTYTCVWTPSRVTYFFDGIEQRTVDSNQIKTYPENCRIICNLAMNGWANEVTYMDVDYIKVYKPINHNYNLPYKSLNNYLHDDKLSNLSNFSNISTLNGSIALNNNNPKQVFYRGASDDRLYQAINTNGIWTSAIVPFQSGYVPNFPAEKINGDLIYNETNNSIIFKGKDNRIQTFYKWNNVWNKGFIDDNFSSNANNISPDNGSMDIRESTTEIFYKGIDNKLHIYYWNSAISDWTHILIPYTYNTSTTGADRIKGDVVVEQSSGKVFYKGYDDRLQMFQKNSSGIYQHFWIDNYTNSLNQRVSPDAGSIITTINQGIYYKGWDNKLRNYSWNGSSYIYSLIPYTYSSPNLGYANADLIKGNLSRDPSTNKIIYCGFDGRIQYFAKSGTNWNHGWIDDYWNTRDFFSYNVDAIYVNSMPSVQVSNNGLIYYNQRNGKLGKFEYMLCENLNPTCSSTVPIRKQANPTLTNTLKGKNLITLTPNPFNDVLIVNFSNAFSNNAKYSVYDINGRLVLSNSITDLTTEINTTKLVAGIYFIKIENGSIIERQKIIKN